MYSTCIRLTVLCLGAHNYGKTVWGCSKSGFSSQGQLQFLDQVLGCTAGIVWSMGLHRGYAVCCRHRCRHRGNFRDSWCLWFCSHRCCRCSRQRLWQLCRLDWCRHCCRNARYGRSLQCGWDDSWGSVIGFDTAFMKVSSRVVVYHAITGVHLVAVFWQGSYHSGRDPDFMDCVIHHNGLTSIQWHQCFATLVSLWFGGFWACVDLLMNSYGWWVTVAYLGWNGCSELVLVQ